MNIEDVCKLNRQIVELQDELAIVNKALEDILAEDTGSDDYGGDCWSCEAMHEIAENTLKGEEE